jgi:serine/threonine protein kinase/CheY-like chemotaxis protein
VRRLGPFTLGARLGSGALGEVFLAVGSTGELVAVKKYDRRFGRDLGFVRDLTTDLEAARALHLKTIARVVDDGREGDQLWAAHQAIAGQTLASVLKRARLENVPLPPALLAWIGAEIAGALTALHEADRTDGRSGFVLGRLSMRDVLIGYEGQVFLTGVGESRARARTLVPPQRLPYCAPEVSSGREPSVRSDVFSLSAILYELFTGAPAFRRSDDYATAEAVRRGDVVPLRPARIGVEPRIGDLVMQGLLPRPEARLGRVDEVGVLLRDAAGDDADAHAEELGLVVSELFREQLESWHRMTAALAPERLRDALGLRPSSEASSEPEEATDDEEPILLTERGSDENSVPEHDVAQDVAPDEVPTERNRVSTDDLLGGHSTEESQAEDPAPSRDAEPSGSAERGQPARARAEERGDDEQRLSRVARYRIGRRIEVHGPRQRFLATDPNLGREVEIEVLDPSAVDGTSDRSDWIRAIKQEGRHAAQLQVDGLPRLLDAGRGAHLYFLVYERRPGRSLPRHLAEGRPLNPAQIVADLAGVLDQVHRSGFVLGDLRPATVRLRTDGSAEVARVRQLVPVERAPHPLANNRSGLRPPELIRVGAYTPASDQFALGALLYQLLLGVGPFQPHDGKSLRDAVVSDRIIPPHVADPEIPEVLSEACLRMLERNPARRFGSMREVVDAMAELSSTVVRAAPAIPEDDTLEVSLAFAHLCRRVAGVSTLSAVDDSPWHPDPAVWASDIARRVGLAGHEVQAVLIAAAARDLARRTHLPVLGPELDMVLPASARTLLGPRGGAASDGAITARAVLDLVERYGELVTSGDATPAGAVHRLRDLFPAELVDALVAHLEDRLPGSGGPGPRVLVAVDAEREALVMALEERGFSVVPAVDGHVAWELVRRATFDGAVLSARLRGRDGLSLLQLCRGREELRSLPIWITGAGLDAADVKMAQARGAFVTDDDRGRICDLVAERLLGEPGRASGRSTTAPATGAESDIEIEAARISGQG